MLPRPGRRLVMLLVAASAPAALAGISRLFAVLALALDAIAFGLFFLDARLAKRSQGLVVRRTAPPKVLRLRNFGLTLEVHNPGPDWVAVNVIDRLPDGFEPREHRFAIRVPPKGRQTWLEEVRVSRRGDYALLPPVAFRATPLGMGTVRVKGEGGDSLAVLPDLSALTHFDELVRQRRLHEMGILRARERGQGTEIDGLRPYAVGDAYSAIDWKATARREAPVTREMHTERRQNVLLLLDCGRRMAREVEGQSRLDYAVEAALLLGHVALRSDDRVALMAFHDQLLRTVPAGRGSAHAQALAQAVFALQPVLREPPYQKIATEVARRFPRRTLAVLFTDAIEPASLNALIRPVRFICRRHLLVCVVFKDAAIEAALREPLEDAPALYRAGAAAELALEREQGLAALRNAGALLVEAPASKLSTAVVNRYLEVKARHQL